MKRKKREENKRETMGHGKRDRKKEMGHQVGRRDWVHLLAVLL